MDCQKFVERCMSDAGLRMDLPGSNAWYRTMTWTGTPEECKSRFGRIPKGALLFILEPVSASTPAKYRNDGIGDAVHIGIRTGRGKGAIHSSQSRGTVCESDFHDKTIPNGGWNRVGLYAKFTYEDLPADWASGSSGLSGAASASHPARDSSGSNSAGSASAQNPSSSGSPSNPDSFSDSAFGSDPDIPATATVTALSGSTVNIRKAKSTKSKLVERVPVGATVRVLKSGETWSRVAYTDPTGAVWCGWMMNTFLRMEPKEQSDDSSRYEDTEQETVSDVPAAVPATTPLYAVTIPFLTEEQARALLRAYSGAWMTKEEM